MEKRKKQLTLQEKWEADIEMYKQGVKILTASPQCEQCRYRMKGDALHCKKYQSEQIPDSVGFPSKECARFEHIHPLSIDIVDQLDNDIKGGIFGFCIGDALGVPVEFSSRKERAIDPVQEMRGYGTYHQPFGTWSDDSSMMLCLIQDIIDGYSIETLAQKFIQYLSAAYMTPYQEVFDIGNSTQQAIHRMMQGIQPLCCGGKDELDNGNGSLMRVLPLAYFVKDKSPFEQIRIIEDVSSLTHAHKRARLACIMYVEYAIFLLQCHDKQQAYSQVMDFIHQYCWETYEKEFSTYARVLNGNLESLSRDQIVSSGYVVDTLEAALWAFLMMKNYKDSIFTAINLGGDTDTIAAITGGLAGIFYGFQSIPNNWVQCLARKEDINVMLTQFRATLG